MKPRPRALAAIVRTAAPFLVVASAHPASRPEEEPLARLELAEVELVRAGGERVLVERGTLRVPVVRAKPESKPIEVDVWRFPALPEAPMDAPPIFQLHGGPGWSGFEPDAIEYDRQIAPMVRMSDLVVVGQRGIGTSTDTPCEGPDPTGDAELSPEERERALVEACRACREHWEAQGFDLAGFNVIEAAADVADVARLLGYEEITLWGASFGSHWSMAVQRYHPELVARAVLTGMEGPDHTYDHPGGLYKALERIAFEAEVSNALFEHVPDDGLLAAFAEVVARAEAEPIVVTVDHPETGAPTEVRFDADDMRDLAFGYTQRASSREGAAFWPADVIALHHGDFTGAARQRLLAEGRGSRGLPTAAFFLLDCGSGISPARLEELHADPAVAVLGNPNDFYELACPAWGVDLGDDFRTGFTTDVPTVIVHGTWDLSTPFENALELLPSFEHHRFVVVEGGTHGALREALQTSPEFSAGLARFVTTGDLAGIPDEVRMPPMIWKLP